MSTRTRRLVAALAALTTGLALTACSTPDSQSSTATEGSKGALAWSFPTQDVNIWNSQLTLMKPIIEDAGYEFLTDSPNFDVKTQVNDWESWVARGDVKAIGGFPADVDSVVAVTAQATAANIPVIGYAVKWDGVDYATLISNYDAGYSVGKAAGEWIVATYGTEKIDVALLADTTSQLGQDQLKGLKEGLAATDASITVTDLEAKTRDDGYKQAQSNLVAHPNTAVWLGIGADMIHGARQALIDSGVSATGGKHYVSATDADNEALDLIKTGTDMWQTSFAWKAADLAEANAKQLISAAEGTISGDITVGVTQVTKDNVDDFRTE
ncbi:sugar ABC transporter substrate-binding protein [Propionicicella superfundia]|uniref:sugar ABC transporter substrate-binding protein n=1 Tax=Propionicicella superfundia TaxID=348582 RepID=UPI000423C2C2|nr:substrate-binding domain-containing protein [Propionicicella superfundia]